MMMDYSPWSEREIWPFLKVTVSLKPERSCQPKSIYMHLTSTYTSMNFLSRFRSIKFFESMVGRGKLAVFEGSSISKTGEAPSTKIGVHALDINLY